MKLKYLGLIKDIRQKPKIAWDTSWLDMKYIFMWPSLDTNKW